MKYVTSMAGRPFGDVSIVTAGFPKAVLPLWVLTFNCARESLRPEGTTATLFCSEEVITKTLVEV